ncbi:MAG TPA: TatD family hydrolase [Solirubrobacterales bacterium]|nr:TatD family hydrolase [Solirubrobacterales bacterium]
MIDSHAHLGLCEPPAAELVANAREAGVTRLLTIGTAEAGNLEAIADAERFDGVFAAVGRHPNSSEGFDEQALATLAEQAAHPLVRAVGETGLDYYRDGAPRPTQRHAFAAQIELAAECDLPLVIHMRDPAGESEAVDEVFATLDRFADRDTRPAAVILHCFSAPARAADAAERGWYCSFAGNVTYPSAAELREAAAQVPEHLLLVETDCPYLSPKPVRGKPNQPANVAMTAALVAEVRGVEPAVLEAQVERNAAALFGW